MLVCVNVCMLMPLCVCTCVHVNSMSVCACMHSIHLCVHVYVIQRDRLAFHVRRAGSQEGRCPWVKN